MSENSYDLTTMSVDETLRLGQTLGRLLRSGDVLCLSGELGAGKTTLTRGVARAWGARENATSPTFTLVNEYTRTSDTQRFYHMDGYRLSGAVEAQTTAFEDILDAPGVIVIEWPERIVGILPDDRLWIDITRTGEGQRTFALKPSGDRATELAQALAANHSSTGSPAR